MFSVSRNFAECQRGVAAIIFAIMLVPILLILGAAINYSDANSKEAEMQQLIDSAVLAAASAKDATDEERVEIAQQHFDAAMSGKLAGLDKKVVFSVNGSDVTGTVMTDVPAPTMGLFGLKDAKLNQKAVASLKEEGRQLDMVFCIDATSSMQDTIDAVRSNALSLEQRLNDELEDRGFTKFSAMRVRVIFFRDFGFDQADPRDFLSYTMPAQVSMEVLTPAQAAAVGIPDPRWATSNQPALRESKGGNFYALPDERISFQNFVGAEKAFGGGDEPEDGFLCLNQAIRSKWAKVGDPLVGHPNKKITTLIPLIVLWTDANALPLNDGLDARNPYYPSSMPRTMADLKAGWDSEALISQDDKMLVFFGNKDNDSAMCRDTDGKSTDPTDTPGIAMNDPRFYDPHACQARRSSEHVARWHDIDSWNKSEVGGTLTEANNSLVDRLADALASSTRMVRLTQ